MGNQKHENEGLANEQVPVVLVAHRQTDEGRRRTRKLFSTLNRRNKPVGNNENIALDEDDVCAIITRELIQSFPLFTGNNVVNSKGKQIPTSNKSAITSLIALYQIVETIIKNKLKLTSSKFKEYKLSRPEDEIINELNRYIVDIMNSFVESSDVISQYVSDDSDSKAAVFRNNITGGHILFRPIVITEYFSGAG